MTSANPQISEFFPNKFIQKSYGCRGGFDSTELAEVSRDQGRQMGIRNIRFSPAIHIQRPLPALLRFPPTLRTPLLSPCAKHPTMEHLSSPLFKRFNLPEFA